MPEVAGESVLVSRYQLATWAEALRLADSYMSLVYHRGAIAQWDTPATPSAREWQSAMDKARRAADELRALLAST